MKEKHTLTKIVLGAGPLNPHIKPRPFQQGGIFGCFIYVPFVGWVGKAEVMALVLVGGIVLAALLPLVQRLRSAAS